MEVEPIRIAVWSGPRNISTAMMRAFENRPDTAVIDEPFYAAWLIASGADHPMREAVLAAQPTRWPAVVETLLGPVPGGRAIFYQKHMAHHMTLDIDLAWMARCRNAFLIRAPAAVLASYAARRPGAEVTLDDIGLPRLARLFDLECARLGTPPPVIDAADVLADPGGMLGALCDRFGIGFDPAMLAWPAGRRATDGVWAPAWYDAVNRSMGFAPPPPPVCRETLPLALARLAEAAEPFYQALAKHRLRR